MNNNMVDAPSSSNSNCEIKPDFNAAAEDSDKDSTEKLINFMNTSSLSVDELFVEMEKLVHNMVNQKEIDNKEFPSSSSVEEPVVEVPGVHYFKKYNFQEIRSFVLKLHENNEDLRKPLQILVNLYEKKYENDIGKLQDKILYLEEELAEAKKVGQTNIKDGKVDMLVSENRILKIDVHDLRDKCRRWEREVDKYYQTDRKMEYKGLISDLTVKLETVEKANRKLSMEYEKLDAECKSLQNALDLSKDNCHLFWNSIFPLKSSGVPAEVQLLKHLRSFEEMMEVLDDPEMRRDSSLENWFTIAAECKVNSSSKSTDPETLETEKLKKFLSQEQMLNVIRKDIISNMKLKFKDIYQCCAAIIRDKKPHQETTDGEERQGHDDKVTQEEVNCLKIELITKESLLRSKENEINCLMKNLDECTKKNEEITLLRDQLKVYEEDFHIEHDAKEAMAAEKVSLKEQLKNLQMKNDEFAEKLHRIQKSSRSEKQLATKNENAPPKQVEQLACIVQDCNKSFDTADELQDHINECLGEG